MTIQLRLLLAVSLCVVAGCDSADANNMSVDAGLDAFDAQANVDAQASGDAQTNVDAQVSDDAQASGDAAADAAGDAATPFFPETCKAIQDQVFAATGELPFNGTYTLYVDGDETKQWDVYCHNMRRAEPTEYLSIDEANNYSQASNGSSLVETQYRRIRINPITLELYPLDDTFANTEADDFEPPMGLDHLPVGFAYYLSPTSDNGGAAESQVSLDGTPFVFDELVDDDGYFGIETMAIDSMTGAASPTESDDTDLSSFDVDSALKSFVLIAESSNAWERVRVAADFENMLAEDPEIDRVVIPLRYVGLGD